MAQWTATTPALSTFDATAFLRMYDPATGTKQARLNLTADPFQFLGGDGTWVNVWVAVPATAASTGTAGQKAYDADYLYICIATDTWKRSPLTTW